MSFTMRVQGGRLVATDESAEKALPVHSSFHAEKPRLGQMSMLIAAKLSPPLNSCHLLPIPRLEERFEAALSRRLICVIAPAGYGKTSTLAKMHDFVELRGVSAGWVSLDSEDNNPTRFLRYVLKALEQAKPGFSTSAASRTEEKSATAEELLLALYNGLLQVESDLALFLDDYHVIKNEVVHDVVSELIAHSPRNIRFFLSSCMQLPFSLSKLYLAQEIHETRVENLSLRRDEAEEFIRRVSGRRLDAAHLKTLCDRTEGWPAGLQLASLALKDMSNAGKFIENFSGTDKDITTYLCENVLHQLAPDIRGFLARTALFNRFSVEFCREVLAEEKAVQLLERVESQNLFLVPLDRHGQWYRYHQLFAQSLKERFIRSTPEEARACYQAASIWFERKGEHIEAITYALDGEHYARAADLISRHAYEIAQRHGKHALLLKWVAALPPKYVERRPEIKLPCIWALIFTQRYREVEAEFEKLEWLLSSPRAVKPIGAKETATDGAIRKALMIQSIFYAITDRISLAEKKWREWLARSENSEPYDVGNMQALMGYSAFTVHDYERATQLFAASKSSYERCVRYLDGVAWSDTFHAMVELERGNIVEAERILVQGIKLHSERFSAHSYGISLMSLLRAQVCYERNRVEEAKKILDDLFSFAKGHGFIETSLAAYLTKARILFMEGKMEEAEECLFDGVSSAERLGLPRLAFMLNAERIHLHLKNNETGRAYRLARSIGLGNENIASRQTRETSAEDIGVRLVEVRLQLETGQTERTQLLLGSLLADARRQGRNNWIIKLLCLKAILQVKRGNPDEALRIMNEALVIGAGGGQCRLFADEGPLVGQLIRDIADRRSQLNGEDAGGVPHEYLMHVLKAFDASCLESQYEPPSPLPSDLVRKDAFSERELQILKLAESGLANRDMALQLFLSEATVKWHLRNIYVKLGVNNRTRALARAREMSLL